jgi:predicted transcriptional regulator
MLLPARTGTPRYGGRVDPEVHFETTTDRILVVLATSEASATELSRILGVHRSIIDRQVDRMVSAGTIVRSVHVGGGVFELDRGVHRVSGRRYRYSVGLDTPETP